LACGGDLEPAVRLVIGLASGYARWIDVMVMRMMDGLMAIPGILLALFLSLWRARSGPSSSPSR
jgi:peptide/nickel transport system permease protein